MSYAYRPDGGNWIEISEAGTDLPGAGEEGEAVTISQAFVESLSAEVRELRGFVEVAEAPQPEDGVVIGWTVADVEGVPTRVWTLRD